MRQEIIAIILGNTSIEKYSHRLAIFLSRIGPVGCNAIIKIKVRY